MSSIKRPAKQSLGQPPGLPYSKAVVYGDFVFVSGSVGREPTTRQIAQGDVAAQTRQTLENIRQALEMAGTSMDRVVKTTVFLADMAHYAAMNEAYRAFFQTDPPARSCVQVAALPDPEALVEIEAIASL